MDDRLQVRLKVIKTLADVRFRVLASDTTNTRFVCGCLWITGNNDTVKPRSHRSDAITRQRRHVALSHS